MEWKNSTLLYAKFAKVKLKLISINTLLYLQTKNVMFIRIQNKLTAVDITLRYAFNAFPAFYQSHKNSGKHPPLDRAILSSGNLRFPIEGKKQ